MGKPAELKVVYNGINILYNDGKIVNDRIEIKISYLTALIFINGKHEASYYPQHLNVKELAEIIADDCKRKAEIELTTEEATAIATYIKEKIK